MEENSVSKAQLLFNSIKEIERAVVVLEDFADTIRDGNHPSKQTVEENSAVSLASVLINAHNELEKLAERIHTAIADLRKSLI